MSFVYVLIPILAVLWLLQGVGTYYQMSHYRKVLGGITRSEDAGYIGVGNAKGRLGKGVILILVFGSEGTVKKALRMRGMTVFARFADAPDFLGMRAEELEEPELKEPYDAGTMLAAKRAVEQVRRIEAEQSKKEEEKELEVRVG